MKDTFQSNYSAPRPLPEAVAEIAGVAADAECGAGITDKGKKLAAYLCIAPGVQFGSGLLTLLLMPVFNWH